MSANICILYIVNMCNDAGFI